MNKIPHEIEHIDLPPHGYVHYIDHLGGDYSILAAARACYKSVSKGVEADRKLLHFLYRNRHTTPFEQVNLTFNIRLPIFVMRQLARHRTFRYNETSLRYAEAPDQFFSLERWRLQADKNRQGSSEGATSVLNTEDRFMVHDVDSTEHFTCDIETAVEGMAQDCKELNDSLRRANVARELARVVLPLSTYTEIYINCDLRNLFHFFDLRLSLHAQAEIRELAKAMYAITKPLYPWSFEAYDRYKLVMLDTHDPAGMSVGEPAGRPPQTSHTSDAHPRCASGGAD